MKTEKRRYILVESTIEPDQREWASFEHDFLKELLHNIGEVNYHSANPRIMKYMGNRFVLRCNLQRYKDTIIALTFMKRVGGREIGFYTLNASGTILALGKEKKTEPSIKSKRL